MAILAAFVTGAAVCGYSTLIEPTPAPAPLLPHRSIVPTSGFATVTDSYDAIPHRRTLFPSHAMGIEKKEADYLRLLFALVDEAIVVRVDATRRLAAGHPVAKHIFAYDEIIDCTTLIPAPKRLQKYHETVRKALVAQRSAIQSQHRQTVLGATTLQLKTQPAVQRSSNLVHQAYSNLMKTYPTASPQVEQAIFDHHCALDFL
jgi:hypothetical protein